MRQDAGSGQSAESTPAKEKPNRRPRADDIVVVTANLAEVHDADDIARPDDMYAFASRVNELVPRPPDVLLLQEVVASAAEFVAASLSENGGDPYIVIAKPGVKSPRLKSATTDTVRDTAILLNKRTMSVAGPGGFCATKYDPSDCAPGKPVARTKEHARTLARHEPSGTRLAMMSIHLAPRSVIANEDRFHVYAERWAKELLAEMTSKHPKRGRQINLLAGDFNCPRCVEKKETIDCETTPMWKKFIAAGYHDVIFDLHGGSDVEIKAQHRKGKKPAARIDYIFTSGGQVIDGSHDLDPPEKGAPGFYSDHRLVWAVIRPPARRKRG